MRQARGSRAAAVPVSGRRTIRCCMRLHVTSRRYPSSRFQARHYVEKSVGSSETDAIRPDYDALRLAEGEEPSDDFFRLTSASKGRYIELDSAQLGRVARGAFDLLVGSP